MKKRLFIGIPIPKSSKIKIHLLLGEGRGKVWDSETRWVPQENYHITLNFLGYIEEQKINDIKNILDDVAKNTKPFGLSFEKITHAPADKPRMLWAQSMQNEHFNQLVEAIEKRLGEYLQLPNARKSHLPIPHITLARFKSLHEDRHSELVSESNKSTFKIEHEILKQVQNDIKVDSFHLYESKLTRNGPIYSIMETFRLAK